MGFLYIPRAYSHDLMNYVVHIATNDVRVPRVIRQNASYGYVTYVVGSTKRS